MSTSVSRILPSSPKLSFVCFRLCDYERYIVQTISYLRKPVGSLCSFIQISLLGLALLSSPERRIHVTIHCNNHPSLS